MAGQATITSVGNVTISTTGTQSGNTLSRINGLIANAGSNIITSDPDSSLDAISAPSPTLQGAIYGVNNGFQGTLELPTGYAAVVIGTNTAVTIPGANSTTAIASDGQLDYSGASAALTSFGDNSVLDDSGDLATIAVGGANLQVTLAGAGQTLNIDTGAQGTFTETGSGDHITFAADVTSTPTSSETVGATSTPGAISAFQLTANTSLALNDGNTASIVILNNGTDTVSAAAGSNTIFANTGHNIYFGGSAQTFFVGATGSTVGVSTIFGGTGNDTVFAQAGVNYTAGTGNNEYIGGSYAQLDGAAPSLASHSTVTATSGHDLLFGGTIGDYYNLGNASATLVAGGGTDTMFGGSLAPTIFSSGNELLKLVGTKASVVVANGNNDVVDASQADQGNKFFVTNLQNVGNTTLIGATGIDTMGGAADSFIVGHVDTSSAVAPARSITIKNFHVGDTFFLSGYTAADGSAFESAVASIDAVNAKTGTAAGSGSMSVTLSDSTTITFSNSHPTAVFSGGKVGL